MSHAPELIRIIEDAAVEVASRPPGLRGPWRYSAEEEVELQARAKAIRERRFVARLAPTQGKDEG